MKRIIATVLLITTALALGACGSKQEGATSSATARPWSLMLDWQPNADHAALYLAINRGYFAQGGLSIKPQIPSDPASPLKLLAAGKVDMAISYEPELLLARDRGLNVVAVAALVQRPLTSLITTGKRRPTRVAQLAGKLVGTAGIPYQSAELQTMLRSAGVDPTRVSEVNVGFNLVPAMVSGRVAATLGGYWNVEAIQLRLLHKQETVIPVDQAGVPTYDELVLAVRADEARHRGQQIRAFIQALARGERALAARPAAGAGAVVRAAPGVDRGLTLASITATLPAEMPARSDLPYGWMDVNAWTAFDRWLYDNHLIAHQPGAGAPPLTDEFLPGQGVPATGAVAAQ